MGTAPDTTLAAYFVAYAIALGWLAELGVRLTPDQLDPPQPEPPRGRRPDPHATLPPEIITRQ